jgi:hypothetical protein
MVRDGSGCLGTCLVTNRFVGAHCRWSFPVRASRYALRRSLLDVPNHRSSHSAPTPRGGGLSIAVVTLVAILLLTAGGLIVLETGLGLAVGGAIVAAIGWIDDHRHVAARWRALAQFVAAGWAVYWIGVPDALWLGAWSVPLGPVGRAARRGGACLAHQPVQLHGWDRRHRRERGGDGRGCRWCDALVAGAFGPGAVALTIAAASIGFLVWNWPPAKIFMGDVGSGTARLPARHVSPWPARPRAPCRFWSGACSSASSSSTRPRRSFDASCCRRAVLRGAPPACLPAGGPGGPLTPASDVDGGRAQRDPGRSRRGGVGRADSCPLSPSDSR